MNRIKILGLIMLLFLSFSSFSQTGLNTAELEEDKDAKLIIAGGDDIESDSFIEGRDMHYIFIIDNTMSMVGIGCCDLYDGVNSPGVPHSPHNIWSSVKNKITGTIRKLDDKNNSMISVYTFSGELEIRNFNNQLINPINEVIFNEVNKGKIIETINHIEAIGTETCIYNSFKMLIDKITADNNTLLRKYNTRIILYTDSEEDCKNYQVNCQNAFRKWCEIKTHQDFAEIIKLDQSSAASTLIQCIEDSDCIEVRTEPVTQTTRYIENEGFIDFSSSDLTETIMNLLDIDLAEYPDVKTPISIRLNVGNDCFSLTKENGTALQEVNILEHTLVLSGFNNCTLESEEVVEGTIIYNNSDKTIYEDEEIKIVLRYPEVRFKFLNKHQAGIKIDFRTK